MKLHLLEAVFTSAILSLTAPVLAQSAAERPAGASTAPSQSPAERKNADSASMGSSVTTTKSDKSFTHGESKRCESLSGADKDQCDKEEATKTQGPAAQEASKPRDSSKQ
jgi:hypothetical protein